MNVLIINGSPKKGTTYNLIEDFKRQLTDRGHEYKVLSKKDDVRGCIHCNSCSKTRNKCIFKDDMTEVIKSFNNFDAVIVASPIWFFQLSPYALNILSRLYSCELENTKFGCIFVSGSEFSYSGTNTILQSMRQLNDYCGFEWIGAFHKTTFDEVQEVNEEDMINIERLIDSLEGENTSASSLFIVD